MQSRLMPNWISKFGIVLLIGGVLVFSVLKFFSGGEPIIHETQHGVLTYSQVPYFDGSSDKVLMDSIELNIEGQSITTLIKYLELVGKVRNVDAIVVTEPSTKYNLMYTSKQDSIFYQDFFNALQSEELIRLKGKLMDRPK